MRKNILLCSLMLCLMMGACSHGVSPEADVRIWAADSSIYIQNNSPKRVYYFSIPERILLVINWYWKPTVPLIDTGGIATSKTIRISMAQNDPIIVDYWWRGQSADGKVYVENWRSRRIVLK
jgi:hypothetical protein